MHYCLTVNNGNNSNRFNGHIKNVIHLIDNKYFNQLFCFLSNNLQQKPDVKCVKAIFLRLNWNNCWKPQDDNGKKWL